MQTREIPPSEWRRFTRDFSRLHNGSIINLQILDPEFGAQYELVNRPFRGIAVERPGSDTLVITSADRRGNHLSHPVINADRMWVERTDAGACEALAIESEHGIKTIVRFRWPMDENLLDPLVE